MTTSEFAVAAATNDDAAAPLPVHLTGFIGREQELEQLSRLLTSTRLLTLTGAGGSGKTRLAREAAQRQVAQREQAQRESRNHHVRSAEHVAWVDLAPISDGVLVVSQIAKALGVAEHANVETTQRIVSALGDREVLLVLDNCEHLVEACARATNELLLGCRGLTILATSREALGVLGETAWLVPRLEDSEAVQLFVERARAAQPAFVINDGNHEAVRQICARLDGIPLALELAAARVRVLSPRQIAARLDDVFSLLTVNSRTALPRHRTLRNTMEWSFALLSEREQSLLRRLAVFSGSFPLEAAESVCADPVNTLAIGDASLEPHDVLDGVAALVDKSLVVMEPGEAAARYRLLETVRQYALERLIEAGERELLQQRHAEHFLEFAEAFAPKLVGGEHEPGLLLRVSREHDNLRAASAWAAADPDRAEAALRFADALFWYWYGTGYWLRSGQFDEARTYLDRAIDAGGAASPLLRGRALLARGLNALAQGDWERARDSLETSLSLMRPIGDRAALAIVLSKLGAAHLMLGEYDRAAVLLEESHEVARDLTPAMVHAFVLFWRGWLQLHQRDMVGLRASHRESLRVGRVLEHHRTIRAHQHSLIARAYLVEGEWERAAARLRDAWTLHRAIGDGWGLSLDLEGISLLLYARGNHVGAASMMGVVDSLRARIAVAALATDAADRVGRIAALRAALGDEYEVAYERGWAMEAEQVAQFVHDATDHAPASSPDSFDVDDMMPTPRRPDVPTDTTYVATDFDVPMSKARLSVHALGPLQVFVDEIPVEAGAWGSARPRELLVYLLLHPEGCTKEQVGLALWPDASTAQLRNSFHVTTYRLRKTLGAAEWIVLIGERYTVNRQLLGEFDVHTFSLEIAEAQRALAAREDGADALMEKALSRYRGDLLDGEPAGEWHEPYRARFQRLYVDALTALGAAHERERRDERAADVYRRVLVRDALHEQAMQALMRAHARLGAGAQALRVFQRFQERLARELRVEPSRETRELAERISRGSDA